GGTLTVPSVNARADGTFDVAGVIPGEYKLICAVSGSPEWFAASAIAERRDRDAVNPSQRAERSVAVARGGVGDRLRGRRVSSGARVVDVAFATDCRRAPGDGRAVRHQGSSR